MQHLLRAALATAAAGLIAAPAGAATIRVRPNAITGGVSAPTKTQAFPIYKGITDLGPVAATTPIRVALGLAPRNASAINTLLLRQMTPGDPLFEQYLTPSQTAAMFSPTGASVMAVANFLTSAGFTNVAVTPDNMIVTATGTAALADAAFTTKIDTLSNGSGTIYANVSPAYVPGSLAGIVTSVLGLNSYALASSLVRSSPAQQAAIRSGRGRTALGVTRTMAATTAQGYPQACQVTNPATGVCTLNSYTATGFQYAYDSPQHSGNTNTWGYTGVGTTIAVFTEGDMTQVLKDLVIAENANVPPLPHVTTHLVNAGIASPDVSGQDEWDLDSQSSTGIAGNVKSLYFYIATSLTDSDTAVDFDRFKTDDIAKAGSASFGECEIFPMLDGAEVLEDAIFAQAAVQGQTVFSSAGDNGTTCPVAASTGVPGTGLPAQSYPGVSPYVVSAGGTTLMTTTATNAYYAEIAWIGTGGGMSETENAPFWQAGVVSKAATTAGYKDVPDVAMDADPNTGALVYVDGAPEGVGGTSLSSPLSLGVWARLESYHANKLGFAAPLFYQEYKNSTIYNPTLGLYIPPTPPAGALTQPIGGFHDVLTGSNGTPALPGYDTTTGVGTFDISKQFADLPSAY